MDGGVSRRRGQRPADKRGLRDNPTKLLERILVVSVLILIMAFIRFQSSLSFEKTGSATTTRNTNLAGVQRVLPQEDGTNSQISDTILVECIVRTPLPPPGNSGGEEDQVADGILQVTVRNDLSPIASKVFLELVDAGYYNDLFIFRVLKGFIAQWGFRPLSSWTATTRPPNVRDDFVPGKTLSNLRGTLSFTSGDPSAQQVFVNLQNNERLDKDNSYPFATLSDASMEIMDRLYTGYQDGQGQIDALRRAFQQEDETVVLEKFPRMSRIERCSRVPAFSR